MDFPKPPRRPVRPQRNKTFTGCWTCRSRKVKCDEKTPECTPCRNIGSPCAGYDIQLVWVTSDNRTYKPNARRFLPCDLTWKDLPVLNSDALDTLIAQCDDNQDNEETHSESLAKLYNPFNVFSINNISFARLPEWTGARLLQTPTTYGGQLGQEEAFLFNHYLHHVGSIMMPFEDHRNPWKSSYPQVALYYASQEQKSLCRAMLAQSALTLAYMGCDTERMMELGRKYYTAAIKQIRAVLSDNPEDYGGLLAAIMTLMFIEVYSGDSKQWRTHFKGAWELFRAQSKKQPQPWWVSEFAYASTQSLCLIKIVSETSQLEQSMSTLEIGGIDDPIEDELLTSVSSSSIFGFTIGATKSLMACISEIKGLAKGLRVGQTLQITDNRVVNLFEQLSQCQLLVSEEAEATLGSSPRASQSADMLSDREIIVQCHLRAFIAAAYIYLYRTLLDFPPAKIRSYVHDVFQNVTQFLQMAGGNLSLWPAFIAAVEVYEGQDLQAAKNWMNAATNLGMGNRFQAQRVIESVWNTREAIAAATGKFLGDVAVDWRAVMRDLDIDVLLV